MSRHPIRNAAIAVALLLSTGVAFASTIRFRNPNVDAIQLRVNGHQCISHPNYFEKVVDGNSTLKVTAEWDSTCNFLESAYIGICRDDTDRCTEIRYDAVTHYYLSPEGEIANDED
jgi:hypothetical protein